MERIYNFSPGPATLPTSVLERARDELLNWRGTGMSVMEVSHRGKDFIDLAERSIAALRELLEIPDNYRVLFLQGGATMQFAAVPLNLAGPGDTADYVTTGNWGAKAIGEARRFLRANEAATGRDGNFTGIPDPATWRLSDDAEYLHLVTNETVVGVEFHEIPEVSDAPIVADMSSTLLSRPVDVARFGVIYAGAQKNVGPPGVTVVIVREDLLGRARTETPTVVNYQVMADTDSMSNTPPTFAWYVAGLVLEWIGEQGGIEAMAERNHRKASKLYAAIDGSDFFNNPRGPRLPVLDEHSVHAGGLESGRRIPQGIGRGGPGQSQGAPAGGRHAGQYLQCTARGGRGRVDRVHVGIRGTARLASSGAVTRKNQ